MQLIYKKYRCAHLGMLCGAAAPSPAPLLPVAVAVVAQAPAMPRTKVPVTAHPPPASHPERLARPPSPARPPRWVYADAPDTLVQGARRAAAQQPAATPSPVPGLPGGTPAAELVYYGSPYPLPAAPARSASAPARAPAALPAAAAVVRAPAPGPQVLAQSPLSSRKSLI